MPPTQMINASTAAAWHQICLPESDKRFIRRKSHFEEIANAFSRYPERRQTLIYEALSHSRHSIYLSTPYVSADIIAVLDYVAVKTPVRLVIGDIQPEEVWKLLRSRTRPGFEVRVALHLHLKLSIFDSLFLISGSGNLTAMSLERQTEQFSTLVDEDETQQHLEHFFDVWNDSIDVNNLPASTGARASA
ncbi:MAG: phospholipase D-like domain-containing protein [Bryobacteraceae bacterium]